MNITIITVFPEIFDPFLNTSLIKRAIDQGTIAVEFIKFSQLCPVKERIDEPTAGPGSGMIIKPALIEAGIAQAEQKWGKGFKIFFTPQGKRLDQPLLRTLKEKIFRTDPLLSFKTLQDAALHDEREADHSPCTQELSSTLPDTKTGDNLIDTTHSDFESARPEESHLRHLEGQERIQDNLNIKNVSKDMSRPHLIIVSTRYEGIDARVEATLADETISIGDYVLMGGDLPAQVFLEAFLRLIPSVVGNQESVEQESFSGALLDHPQYGQTNVWQDQAVPEVIKSGNHQLIENWRREQACKKTVFQRFDWFREHNPAPKEIALAQKHIPAHYAVLMHREVLLKDGSSGTSSVASLDIHDIARSSKTFGLKGYFLVTKLEDQFELINTFLDFWKSKDGLDYNRTRYNALSTVQPMHSLEEVIEQITQAEKAKPLLIATCAKKRTLSTPKIDFCSQGKVWQHQRPVLFIFGTAHGLADSVIDQCDYLLVPIHGMTDYNHLSVRSAAAIIFDRWLGLNPKL